MRTYAPIVHVHEREDYHVTDIREYFDHKTSAVPEGRRLNPDVRPDYANYEDRVACYCRPVGTDGDGTFLFYYVFHAFNGSKRVLGVVPVGAHLADVETVVVHVDRHGRFGALYASTHGEYIRYALRGVGAGTDPHEGGPLAEVETSADGRPMLYAALHSHALYHRPHTTYVRFGGLGSDYTGGDTRPVELTPVDVTTASHSVTRWTKHLNEGTIDPLTARTAIHTVRERLPTYPTWFGWVVTAMVASLLPLGTCLLTRDVGWTLAAALGQCTVAKLVVTPVLPLVGAPRADPDSFWKWVFPYRPY